MAVGSLMVHFLTGRLFIEADALYIEIELRATLRRNGRKYWWRTDNVRRLGVEVKEESAL